MSSVLITGAVTGGALALGASAPSVEPPPAPEPQAAEVSCPDADGDLGKLRSCLEESIVFLTTDAASLGTGILLADGQVVTNAHVVGLSDEVDVAFADGEVISGVPVLGVDTVSDVALLDLPNTNHRGIELAALPAPGGFDESTLYLVGFPGAIEDDPPVLGMTQGVLSRRRAYDLYGQTVLQSDASIAGGQSGGALVAADGRVLGLSGYYAFGFSYSLSSDDVLEAIGRIRSDGGSPRVTLPTLSDDDNDSQLVKVESTYASRRLYVPAQDAPRTLTIEVRNSEFSLKVATLSSHLLGSYDLYDAGDWETEYPGESSTPWYSEVGSAYRQPVLEADDDGLVSVEVPAGEAVIVQYSPYREGVTRVEMSEPYIALDVATEGAPIELGETVTGTVDLLTAQTMHTVELDAGDEITVRYHGSPLTPSFVLMSPDDPVTDSSGLASYGSLESTGLGFLDQEMTRTFVINRSGEFRVLMSAATASDYVLTVERSE